jgi:hypothetical protein
MSVFDRLYDSLEPVQNNDLELYIQAIAAMIQPIADIVEDDDNGEPGWSMVVDLTRVPDDAIEWLGQFIGVRIVNPALTPAQKKNLIASKVGWDRGTTKAMVAEIQAVLTGNKTVFLRERDTSAYHFSVVTYTTETPSTAAVNAAILRQKPAGLQYSYATSTGGDYLALRAAYATYTALKAAFTTYAGVRANAPGT